LSVVIAVGVIMKKETVEACDGSMIEADHGLAGSWRAWR
jgi:hypothetical protein